MKNIYFKLAVVFFLSSFNHHLKLMSRNFKITSRHLKGNENT